MEKMIVSGWDSTEYLNRLSVGAQWLAIAFAVLTALCGGAKIIVTKRLDALRDESSRTRDAQLRDAREKLSALEADQKPRRLSDHEAATLRSKLASFPKQRVDISAHLEDHESLDFAFDVQKTLVAAGWEVKGVGFAGFHVKPGIFIWYQPGSKAEIAATRLIELLQQFGFQTNVQKGIADKELILLSTGRRKD